MLFDKILIANRGEIAMRVMRTCKKMGIATVAIYSNADQNALFVQCADEAINIGGLQPSESYLIHDKIIEAALKTGAQAIHPGYGFLSENADFARRCQRENITFIGPNPDAIEAMGSKIAAKHIMRNRGVPTIPGYEGSDQSLATLCKEANNIGFPVLIKASAGGGGKGMRIVRHNEELEKAINAAQREAKSAFGDDTLLLEKYFDQARHIEFQIFGDKHGNAIHCFERECSIQRRYQKIIEESPSVALNETIRAAMGEAAVAAAQAIGYDNAGTVEFILTPTGEFYFLEVNTRLQVEHPVTEMITNLDLVQMQIEVAQGKALPLTQAQLLQNGHAIEVRIYAEDPANNFMPATGTILEWNIGNAAPDMRYDSGVATGSTIDIYYDPMIAKIIAKADNRNDALRKMRRALQELNIMGITTNKAFLLAILQNHDFINGNFDTHFLDKQFKYENADYNTEQRNYFAIAALLFQWQQHENNRTLLKQVPANWRNNQYAPAKAVFSYENNEINCQYRYFDNNIFEVYVEQQTYSVKYNPQSDKNGIDCTINSHRLKFRVLQSADKLYVHQNSLGNATLHIVPDFPNIADDTVKGGYQAQMPSEVVKILVEPGQEVKAGDGLIVLVSMKMETTVEAYENGKIMEIFVAEKAFVETGTLLLTME
jgi:acetyl-CoA carboxylase biotin carboxylase subunit